MSAVWSEDTRSSLGRMAADLGSTAPLSSLVYQSRAIAPLSEVELEQLLTTSQTRNRKEGVSGLLVYDQGRFLQWLEGPREGVGRVWQSIRNDRRHTAVSLLEESTKPERFFGTSPMALGKRGGDDGGERLLRSKAELPAEIVLPAEVIETLYQRPEVAPAVLATLAPRAADKTLKAVVNNVIIPGLLAKHASPLLAPLVTDPHAAELARMLATADHAAVFGLIDRLRADGRSVSQLCAGLFEPAARALGDMWRSDDCSEFELTLGLGYLQVAVRRAGSGTSSAGVPRLPLSAPHAVLVAPSPRESHLLGSVIASEMFWRAGWDVSCEFPGDDAALRQLVHDRWFDVLDLSLSGAFTRDHRLPAMAASIRAAHESSLNPALVVIVDGRVFNERPRAFAEVGADAGSASALDLVATAVWRSRLNKR